MSLVADSRFSAEYETYNTWCMYNGEAYSPTADSLYFSHPFCTGNSVFSMEGTGFIPYPTKGEMLLVNKAAVCETYTCDRVPVGLALQMTMLIVPMLYICFAIQNFNLKKKGNKKCLQTGKRR